MKKPMTEKEMTRAWKCIEIQTRTRKPMTSEELALARKWLDVRPDQMLSDAALDGIVNGTYTHARIQLKLACDRFKKELLHALFGRLFK